MASNFQDDERENEMRMLFNLYKDEAESRSGVDAYLRFNNHLIPFELKTTSIGSVTTARDFGLDHIQKWQGKHWLIGFFLGEQTYYKYASPQMMAPWIESKSHYIKVDFELAELAPDKITLADMYNLLSKKSVYTLADAQHIQKRQYTKAEYLDMQDAPEGYSPNRMLEILKARVHYLVKRGSTLNNPHIPFSYFAEWEAITSNHAQRLRELVAEQLEN